MSKIITCPCCGERINLNNLSRLSKLSKKSNSAEFFDINDENQKEVAKLLRQKNIEFGDIDRTKK